MKNWPFHQLLRARRLNVKCLAARAGVGRCHLTQVLRGARPGGETWPKLFPLLTHPEIAALGQIHAFQQWKSSTRNNVPTLNPL